jgi:hypothetical protein
MRVAACLTAALNPALQPPDQGYCGPRGSRQLVMAFAVTPDGRRAVSAFTVPRLVAELSAIMTLEPGDIVATGTPAGVGTSRTPKRWMRPGERVRVEIEKIGALENPIVAATP